MKKKSNLYKEKRVAEVKNGILALAGRTKQRLVGLCIVILLFACSAFAAEQTTGLKEITDGVYVAFEHCNSAVIILEDGVLVVDTQITPSAARSVIEQIKTVTDKPVKYVVVTHYHDDHFQGSSAYFQAYPGVEIISSLDTYTGILQKGLPRTQAEIISLNKQIKSLKRELTKTTKPERQTELKQKISNLQKHQQDLKEIGDVMPTLTFEKRMVLHSKDRVVEILDLGKGHTESDTVVFLPKERILCTGDLVHDHAPYMWDSYPYEWIKNLEAVEKLEFDKIIGGHGDVIGKERVTLWKNYLKDLMKQTEDMYAQGASLEDVNKKIDFSKYESTRLAFSREDDIIHPHVKRAYRAISWVE